MIRRFAILLVVASTALASAQTAPKKIVTSEADLPRISYPVSSSASELLIADDATFGAFAAKVGADADSILATYDIEDKATLRRFLAIKANAQILAGNPAGALESIDRVRDLEEKPDAKLTSGLFERQLLTAWVETGSSSSPAFQAAFQKNFSAAMNALPWAATSEYLKEIKVEFEVVSPSTLVGDLKQSTDPQVLKSGTIDFRPAARLLDGRIILKIEIPLGAQIESVLTPYIAAHTVEKPDIWAARQVTLTDNDKLTPVLIGIWDSGVDTAIYPKQLFTDPAPGDHGPHGLAYDVHGKLFYADLQPLSPDQSAAYPKVLERKQGFDDLQNGIDSPAAAETRKYFSTTPPDQLAPFLKQMQFLGQYMHGTHVAGIAVRGNPAARLVVLQFYDSLAEIPFAPTVEWANQFKVDFQQLGDYVREHNVRVVNMSWGDSQGEIERWLTKTSTEKDPEVRKKMALQIYLIWRDAVQTAIQSAPKTLFVCAAGNSDSDPTFVGDVPVSLHLPNLIAVGAVDQAGDETSFTSHGETVVLDADGYRVESYVPGGTRLRLSGTSMASPNVANLAAKLFALDPALTPEEAIALMKKGSDPSPDGRRHLINPRRSVELLENGKTTLSKRSGQ
jgi:subtilisin family serine protease